MLAVALAAAAGIGWYYSDQILGPDRAPAHTGQQVLAQSDSTITLATSEKARRPGHWAIQWPGGHGKIGPVIEIDEERVVTRFVLAAGPPPKTDSRLAGFAREADPRTWLGVDFTDIVVPARIGPLPAWLIPGTDSTWALFVHGRAANRAEVLRMLPGYISLGLPCLVLSYRNDEGAPSTGGYRMGATEWQDLEDAVREARARGAHDVVLVGCSMGGGIVAQFLRHSPLRAIVRVAVLDAPALDWNAVLELQGQQRGAPGFITALGKAVASLRSGIRWDELTQADHADEFSTPILIFHGNADDTVPISVSERFAEARPDLVTFIAVGTAGHVESANVDPGYADMISGWLSAHGVGVSSSGLQ